MEQKAHSHSTQVIDWIEYHASTKPDARAMVDLASGRIYSYGQMHERVARAAGMLKAHGIKPGDRVAFLCLNTTDIMELIFGCWRIGAICLALNFRLTPPELAYILNDSDASLVLVDDPFKAVAEATKPHCESVEHWISTDGVGGDSDYEQGLAKANPVYDFYPQSYDEQCLLMYSSGTTGHPKGVIITHGMIEFTNAGAMRVGDARPDRVSLNNMPLFHIGGLQVTGLPSLWIGGCCVIMRLFDVDATLKAIDSADLNIAVLFMVPAAYNAMRMHPKIDEIDFSRIEIALGGGETVPEPLTHFWLTKGLVIQEGYGMTETCAAGTTLRKEDIPHMIGSAGRPLSHSRIKIVDESDNEVARGEAGEILFKGASVTPGYWRKPEANERAFTEDGWFRSGDIGRMDDKGYVFIEDRVKDMYISGGENVYPAEIEGILYEMPHFAELSVIGIPHEKWGETGCVVAVFKEGHACAIEDILAHLEGRLARYKMPSCIHIIEALPRGGSGKVLKYQLRKTVPGELA
ncbi:acid--CoA ligase [Algimonas ampicilliniresistens]|uniref:Acid--CoA ligase n=1 Tax=Algimonas ampicilliniresistens TaxID=1298735 RepID=A0ABQ5V8R8_9PROT|nr:long-chain fatty acid--CoA ligase [Algimonas ampicilliniresistens]GLQ23060.1 acid--CoA ligase [Algimonas ampicilliniresistens]